MCSQGCTRLTKEHPRNGHTRQDLMQWWVGADDGAYGKMALQCNRLWKVAVALQATSYCIAWKGAGLLLESELARGVDVVAVTSPRPSTTCRHVRPSRRRRAYITALANTAVLQCELVKLVSCKIREHTDLTSISTMVPRFYRSIDRRFFADGWAQRPPE
jgi:hypothetical protein